MLWRVVLFGFAVQLLTAVAIGASLSLAPVFTDAMVLQQSVPIPIWGDSKAGIAVTVSFAGQRKTTISDKHGKWIVSLDALTANEQSRELSVRTAEDQLIVRDILVGEVWVAAGQSNMEFAMINEAHAKDELPKADLPQLRLLNLAYVGQNYFQRAYGPEVTSRLTPEQFYQGNWQASSPISAKNFSAVSFYFGKEVHENTRVPVGVIHLAVGGSPTEAWIRSAALMGDSDVASLLVGNWLENESQESWCRQRGRENLASTLNEKASHSKDSSGPNHPFKPTFLWEAGIARLIPFPIRGVIWYQGESNSLDLRRVKQHERLFPLLIADWRKQWGIGKFPFYYCQLSSIGTSGGYKAHHWPEFRDSQRRMLGTIPNIGMAVTSDLGHPTDVHPHNKRDVGHRLALLALSNTYGKKIAFSGPLAKSVRREGSCLVVEFDHSDSGLKSADEKLLRGFEVSGDDRVFHPAQATLCEGGVMLCSETVSQPIVARYGWQPYSLGNLVNHDELPASTFELELLKQ